MKVSLLKIFTGEDRIDANSEESIISLLSLYSIPWNLCPFDPPENLLEEYTIVADKSNVPAYFAAYAATVESLDRNRGVF